jgi:hypothetical protein
LTKGGFSEAREKQCAELGVIMMTGPVRRELEVTIKHGGITETEEWGKCEHR